MLFNSIEFVIFILAVLFVLSVIKHLKFQHAFLLFSSYLFFYFSSHYLLSLLIFSTVLDYYIAKFIYASTKKSTKKILLIISLSCNLGLLGFFKYVNFTIEQLNSISNINMPYLEIILPIGISFYTFQTISYTVDVYRGKLTPSTSFREFAIFVSFFPQLVAGPILRASNFLPQLRAKINSATGKFNLRQITLNKNNVRFGLTLIAFGFLKDRKSVV